MSDGDRILNSRFNANSVSVTHFPQTLLAPGFLMENF
jgi:hypothetical protein